METLREKIGENIRIKRVIQKKSQFAVATIAGVTPTYYCGIEKGKHNISIDILEQIAIALNVTIADLLPPEQQATTK